MNTTQRTENKKKSEKWQTFTVQFLSTRIFEDFKSRWMIGGLQ